KITVERTDPRTEFQHWFYESLVERYGEYGALAPVGPGKYTFVGQCGPSTIVSGFLTDPTHDLFQIPLIFGNRSPILTSLVAKAGDTVVAGAPKNSVVTLVANATDPDGDPLNFTWGVNAGSITSVNGNTAQWKLPDGPGLSFAYVLVTDGKG